MMSTFSELAEALSVKTGAELPPVVAGAGVVKDVGDLGEPDRVADRSGRGPPTIDGLMDFWVGAVPKFT